MKVIIVEDELLAYKELERMLFQIYPNTEIIAHFDTVQNALKGFPKVKADLAFFDISLPDGFSFEILNAINIDIPIIFTTAYDEHAIKAFKYNSIDYLLKPIDLLELKQAIAKFEKWNSQKILPDMAMLSTLFDLQKPKTKKRFLIKTGDKYAYINTSDIAYFYAEDKTTFIKTYAGRKHISDYSLNEIEQLLGNDFFRITRNLICALQAIKTTSKYFNSRLKLELTPSFSKEVLVSRVRVKDFLEWLDS